MIVYLYGEKFFFKNWEMIYLEGGKLLGNCAPEYGGPVKFRRLQHIKGKN